GRRRAERARAVAEEDRDAGRAEPGDRIELTVAVEIAERDGARRAADRERRRRCERPARLPERGGDRGARVAGDDVEPSVAVEVSERDGLRRSADAVDRAGVERPRLSPRGSREERNPQRTSKLHVGDLQPARETRDGFASSLR